MKKAFQPLRKQGSERFQEPFRVEGPPVRFSWPDGNKALRDNVAVPQSFFYALFPSGAVHRFARPLFAKIIVRCSIFAAFVDFHFNSKALS
ncbi:hypothetical protein [Rhizobium sp. M1]|uniref:hypothetical protein n=1 Tax=Rhizobium sp. M1 TaxID=2035453 RepID=UPI001144D9E8|nr:hypothetical protein [Rhizobium sp. M1]